MCVHAIWQNKIDTACSICMINPSNRIPAHYQPDGISDCYSICPVDGNEFCGSTWCPQCSLTGITSKQASQFVQSNRKLYESKNIFQTASVYAPEHPISSFHWATAIFVLIVVTISVGIVAWLVYTALVYTVINPNVMLSTSDTKQ